MADLGPGEDLASLLLHGTAASAERGLVLLAEVLGRMHAATIGREGEYNGRHAALCAWADRGRTDQAKGLREAAEKIARTCDRLSEAPPDRFFQELETVAASLAKRAQPRSLC